MTEAEFIEKWTSTVSWTNDDLEEFASDLSALIEQEKRKARIQLLKDLKNNKYDIDELVTISGIYQVSGGKWITDEEF